MKRLIGAATALVLATASVAMADDHHARDDRRDWSVEHRDFDNRRHDDRRDWRHDGRDRAARDRPEWREHAEWHDRRDHDWNEGSYRREDYRPSWGYREHDWRRGERLPDAYYAPTYVVGNYGAYGLREPPYGCHWIRVNGDVVLAAIATGVVLDVVYNAF
jgi:Ni/Co efflux regulator RcnB